MTRSRTTSLFPVPPHTRSHGEFREPRRRLAHDARGVCRVRGHVARTQSHPQRIGRHTHTHEPKKRPSRDSQCITCPSHTCATDTPMRTHHRSERRHSTVVSHPSVSTSHRAVGHASRRCIAVCYYPAPALAVALLQVCGRCLPAHARQPLWSDGRFGAVVLPQVCGRCRPRHAAHFGRGAS